MREKIKQLRKNFKLLDETKPKGKVGEKCKRKKKGKKRGKKTKSCRRQLKGKSRGGKRLMNKARYYLENGKYKRNEKFDSWANEVTKMWKKVNICQAKFLTIIFLKVKRDSSCSCGLPTVDRTRIVNGAEAKVEKLNIVLSAHTGALHATTCHLRSSPHPLFALYSTLVTYSVGRIFYQRSFEACKLVFSLIAFNTVLQRSLQITSKMNAMFASFVLVQCLMISAICISSTSKKYI